MLDPRTHQPPNYFHETREPTNSVLWPSKPPLDDDSGICSPPLWTTSPPHRIHHFRSLSPTSRTQAIVNGQRELMEMVKNMPESNYELSLKDLVEQHHRVDARQDNAVEEERNLSAYKRESVGRGSRTRKVEHMPHVKRNGNIDRGGFYLKMVFPFSLGSKDKKKMKGKKKNESLGNSSSKVTPKPDGSTKGVVDKEWWKKSPSACRESDSGESSINSGSVKSSGSSSSSNSTTSRSNSRRENGGGRCWHFIRIPKRITRK
ncbi:uncharacterized protein LOC113852686 [Abrus precatorius]|uniref:Uncharacterized protein LOC113852686 n=1 Tax=Abrus precatorius TaxID=3816 RepID=A0A8B8K596_ABRPR|nr:uncharacterized protein LOC113852686 [Abrus precatorius]